MTVQYITNEKKKGVFLSIRDWKALQNELLSLQKKMSSIEKRRNEILYNYRSSKKEKHLFSSDINVLKTMLK